MDQQRTSDLRTREPRAGDALVCDGVEWKATGVAIYRNDEGYRVHEWRCEAGDETAYLLKEEEGNQGPRWFFTREIAEDAVALPEGEALEAWMGRGADPKPPAALTYHQNTYRYESTTEGTHEDDSGQRVRKVTWDFWDGAHAHNLAVERWPDGSFDCYLGIYVRPDQVTFRAAAASKGLTRRLQAHPFLAAAVFLPCAYFLAFLVGRPVDEGLAFAIPAAALCAWLLGLPRAPFASAVALLAAPVLGGVFWHFAPLGSGPGIGAMLVAPAAIARSARGRASPGGRAAVLYAATAAVAAPLAVLGLYVYFTLAPGPHTPEQLALALGPAALGGLAARLVAGLAFPAPDEGTA